MSESCAGCPHPLVDHDRNGCELCYCPRPHGRNAGDADDLTAARPCQEGDVTCVEPWPCQVHDRGRAVRALCDRCASGRHPHDTFTGDRAGEDAGCPMAVDGHECRCQVRLPKVQHAEDLAAWVTRVLGVQLLPWQREFLKRWERR